MAPQNNYNSNIKDHWPQSIITNIMLYINKSIKFWHIVRITKMWQRDKMHKCCWKGGTDKTCSMQGCYKHSICLKKKALFAKCNKAKWIKMRHTYLYLKKDRYSTKTIFYQYYDLVFPLDAWLACELLRTRTLFAKHGKVCEYWHVEWTFSSSIDTVNNRNKAFI